MQILKNYSLECTTFCVLKCIYKSTYLSQHKQLLQFKLIPHHFHTNEALWFHVVAMLWNGMISKQALSIFNFLIFSLLCCTHAYDTCTLKRISKGINISIFSTLSSLLQQCFKVFLTSEQILHSKNTFINFIHHYYVLHLTPLKCVLI